MKKIFLLLHLCVVSGTSHAGVNYAGTIHAGAGYALTNYAGNGYAGVGHAETTYALTNYAGNGYAGVGHNTDTTRVPFPPGERRIREVFGEWELQELVKGGRIDAICWPGGSTVVCGTRHPDAGKLFISDNKGISWKQLSSPTSNGITCIAGSRNHLYILTEQSEIFGSEDGGLSWKFLKQLAVNRNKEGYATAYSLMLTSTGTLLASDTDSDGGHVYRSEDEGRTWNDMGVVSKDALYRFVKSGNGIILNGWEGAVYKSIDDGKTWNRLKKLSDHDLFATEYLGSHYVLQGDKDGNIFRSNNLGDEWHFVTKLHGSADDFIDVGYGTVYYSTYTGEYKIYLSMNYGKDWMDLGALPSGIQGDWLDHGIRIDLEDSVIVIAGTSKGHIARNAISRETLYDLSNQYLDKQVDIPAGMVKSLDRLIVDQHYEYTELVDPEDILLHNGYAYLPCRDGNNVAVFHVGTTGKARLVYSLRDPDILDAFSVAASGNYLYVLSMTNAMVSIFDIRNPSAPRKISALRVGGEGSFLETYRSNYTRLRKIAVMDGIAYVTHSSESKVYLIDVKDPRNPEIISGFHTGDGAFALLPNGHQLFLAGYGPGSSVILVDISDPRRPVVRDRHFDSSLLQGTCALAIEKNILYAVAYNAGTVWAYDISEPGKLKKLASFRHPGMKGPGRIAVKHGMAYVINSSNDSMIAIDWNDPLNPLASYFIQDRRIKKTYGLAVDERYIYLAGRDARSFLVVDRQKADGK